ncbi:GH16886 [Drosophila grimshawi]|uniref:glutaminyl-peptide cyclotransferase n=1 Tax=Drosophila grimshawi TaxID=7222 RepID=B4IXC7_DROGR|nr:GH16886 [Drosophila grimshawi]
MNPNATHFLMLSCHYDSKYLEVAEEYVAATDGAVSCAILLNMAKRLKYFFSREFSQRKDIGLLLVFFDGHDSVNGITDMTYPLFGSSGFVESETIPLKQITLLISLNLIGAPNHIYMSRYEQTFGMHERMAEIELELRQLGLLSECHQLFYKLKDHDSDIDDDHNSFLESGLYSL